MQRNPWTRYLGHRLFPMIIVCLFKNILIGFAESGEIHGVVFMSLKELQNGIACLPPRGFKYVPALSLQREVCVPREVLL